MCLFYELVFLPISQYLNVVDSPNTSKTKSLMNFEVFTNVLEIVCMHICVYICIHAAAKLLQSCPTLCDPIGSSPPGCPSLGFSRQERWSGLPFPSPMHERKSESEVAQSCLTRYINMHDVSFTRKK